MRFIQLFLWLWIFYILWRLLLRPAIRSEKPTEPEKSARGEDMVRDPHCGTYVPLSLGLRKTIKGRPYYFCSEECRNAFKPPADHS